MPRFAHDEIYKRIVPNSFNWARRASARYIRRRKVKAIRGKDFYSIIKFCGQGEQLRSIASCEVLRSPLPLYLRAMAFERSRNYEKIPPRTPSRVFCKPRVSSRIVKIELALAGKLFKLGYTKINSVRVLTGNK